MKPTDISNPDYFHKVVDCQWACPAHTPVPEYIRLIAHGRYTDAYMINWKSNVFPGILGRTCDRPCEPACRRSRVEDETLVRQGIRKLLELDPRFAIAGEVADGEEALCRIAETRPDVVLLDVRMPKLDGLGVLRNPVVQE